MISPFKFNAQYYFSPLSFMFGQVEDKPWWQYIYAPSACKDVMGFYSIEGFYFPRLFPLQIYRPNSAIGINSCYPFITFAPSHPKLLHIRSHRQLHALRDNLYSLVRTPNFEEFKAQVMLV